jgi:hypothetical protein
MDIDLAVQVPPKVLGSADEDARPGSRGHKTKSTCHSRIKPFAHPIVMKYFAANDNGKRVPLARVGFAMDTQKSAPACPLSLAAYIIIPGRGRPLPTTR